VNIVFYVLSKLFLEELVFNDGKEIPDAMAVLFTNGNLSVITNPFCIDQINLFTNILKPYTEKQDTYFYDLFAASLDKVSNSSKREEIKNLIDGYSIKRPLIPHIKKSY
jgi:hypothetical protein